MAIGRGSVSVGGVPEAGVDRADAGHGNLRAVVDEGSAV